MEIKHIFVVFDPTKETQPALDRGAAVAKATAASLHIYCCIFADLSKSEAGPAQIKLLLSQQQEALKKFSDPLLAQGLKVTTQVEWDKDWYHAAVRSSVHNSADIVLKSSFKHTPRARKLNRTSDWTLIRECLCPVLLVKEHSPRTFSKVLAAIDIRKNDQSYEKLNRQIIDFGRKVADSTKAEVHFINAFGDLSSYPDRNALLRYCGVEADKIHILMGEPEDVIITTARDLDASLVVVGNSARSGLAGVLRGNTVEKVLDRLDCDILSMP